MKKILMYDGPNGQVFAWDITAENQRETAYLELFKFLQGLRKYEGTLSSLAEEQLYAMAKRGNARFAEALLLVRKENPGEGFREIILQSGPTPVTLRQVKRVEVPEALAEPPPLVG